MGNSSDNSCCADWEEQTVPTKFRKTVFSSRRGSRFYTFAVTTLAVFLASFFIRQPAPVGYEWEAAIRHTVAGDIGVTADLLSSDPTDELVQQCRQVTSGDVDVTGEPCAIQVACTSDPGDAAARTIFVRHRHEDKSEGLACLTRTVDRFIAAHNRSGSEAERAAQRDQAVKTLHRWEMQVTTIERELADYVHFVTKRSVPAATVPVQTATTVVNPRWESLSRQFHDADTRLHELRQRFTDQHPHVIEAQRVVSALERVLDTTPQNLEVSPASESAQTVAAPAEEPGAAYQPTFDSSLAHNKKGDVTQSSTYQALHDSLQQAMENRRLAAEALREIPAGTHAILESAILEQPPRLVRTIRAPINRTFLLSQLLPAVLFGVAMAIPRRREVASPTLYSSADVEESLDLPVYGTLSTHGEPSPPADVRSPLTSTIKHIVIASEIMIGAVILVIIVCAIVVPGFANDLVQDPLNAVTTGLQRLGIYR